MGSHDEKPRQESSQPREYIFITNFILYISVVIQWQINMGGNINPLGIFYVNISMGKPAQSIAVAVDSG